MEFEHKVAALDDEDLVVVEKEEKNWKGIVISLLVIGSIMGAIVVAIILCSPDGDTDANKMRLDFEQVLSNEARGPRGFSGAWLSRNEIVYVDQNGSIVVFDAETNKSSSMLVKTYDKTLHTMAGFKLSPSRECILFITESRYEFGARISARYAIFNISSQTVEFLDDLIKANDLGYPHLKSPQIQHADWGHSGNSIVFIESNDIYYVPDFSFSNSSLSGRYTRLTKTGAISESLKNGLPDNLYRTHIFNQPDEATLYWSPDGRFIAYLTFDDALVDQTPIEHYDNYWHEANLNPRIHYERYSRAGALNPRVSVYVVEPPKSASSSSDLDDPETSLILPPPELIKQQQMDPRMSHYVTYVAWSNSYQLLVMWSNRAQNSSWLSSCEREKWARSGRDGTWRCETVANFAYRIPPSVGARRTILHADTINNTRLIFFALPRPDSVIGDHYHVAMLRGEDRAPKYLTHGQFDVDRLLAYDAPSDTLFFEAKVSESAERHLYQISTISQMSVRQTKCLTCQLMEPCAYNVAHMSPFQGAQYFVHECQGPEVPTIRMRRLPVAGESQPQLANQMVLNVDEKLNELVHTKQMPVEKFVAIKANQQFPYDVHIRFYLPTESEEEKDKRFPLLVESTELGERKVWKRFRLDWGKYLASRKQVVYAQIDCLKGGPTMPAVTLGGGESSSGGETTSDGGWLDTDGDSGDSSPLASARVQVEAIKFVADNPDLFPFVDRRRIAIWGPTSTSAHLALVSTLADDTKTILCTIAVAPITNWRYASSYLAERYFGLPWLEANHLKYEQANLLKRANEFAVRKLLIIHGTADEQVHVQHTMQFIKALTEHHPMGGVIHQMQLYPDVGHSLEPVKKHLYMTLDGFVDRCFYQKPIAIRATEWKGKRPKLY